MVFGEIVEPSSRAIWDEDIGDYPEYTESNVKWQNQVQVPLIIEALMIIETDNLLEIFNKCVIDNKSLLCSSKNGGVNVYQLKNEYFAVLYNSSQAVVGEIADMLRPWIENSKIIYAFTTASLASYQNLVAQENSNAILRYLSTKRFDNKVYQKLESPNLIKDLSASVFSLCVHLKLTCVAFITYLDVAPLDSLSAKPLLDLLHYLGLENLKSFESKMKVPSNNLYM